MSKKAYETIATGLQDALSYAKGDASRVTRVHQPVPPVAAMDFNPNETVSLSPVIAESETNSAEKVRKIKGRK
jgi:hypothetical protein